VFGLIDLMIPAPRVWRLASTGWRGLESGGDIQVFISRTLLNTSVSNAFTCLFTLNVFKKKMKVNG